MNKTKDPKSENSGISVVEIQNNGYLLFKRIFDIVLSFIAIIILFIPMAIVFVCIKLESPGPAIFKQNRVGYQGKIFVIYKFRSMHITAPPECPTNDLKNSKEYITKFGNFLRKTSIDELPQLYNILKGDMSFVGFRPVCVTEKKLNALRHEYGVFATKPGLTGIAQVCGRDRVPAEEKVKMDCEYIKTISFSTDLKCLLKTVGTVITGDGIN